MDATITELQLEKFLHAEWMASRRGGPRPECLGEWAKAPHPLDPRRVMARQVEQFVRERLVERGWHVAGTRHKASFDLLAQGVRIEVKAATWTDRYQCNLHSNEADVLVWVCLDGTPGYGGAHSFVIPFEHVRGRRVLEITQRDPREALRWMAFYEAWDTIDALVAAGRNAWQSPLL